MCHKLAKELDTVEESGNEQELCETSTLSNYRILKLSHSQAGRLQTFTRSSYVIAVLLYQSDQRWACTSIDRRRRLVTAPRDGHRTLRRDNLTDTDQKSRFVGLHPAMAVINVRCFCFLALRPWSKGVASEC